MFLLNISDHIRNGKIVYVSEWHLMILLRLKIQLSSFVRIETPRMKKGANRNLRVDYEYLFVLEKKC